MRMTLFLQASQFPLHIPWHYPEIFAAWFHQMTPDYSGFDDTHHATHRKIRPYAFSRLEFPDAIQATTEGLHPTQPAALIHLGVADPALRQHLESRLPRHPLTLQGQPFYQVDTVQPEALPSIHPWVIRLTSSLLVTTQKGDHRLCVSPDDPLFVPLIRQNLAKKARQFFGYSGDEDGFQLSLPTRWQRKMVRLYGTPMISWASPDALVLDGPPAVLEAAWTFGLGVSNSHGFGAIGRLPSTADPDVLEGVM